MANHFLILIIQFLLGKYITNFRFPHKDILPKEIRLDTKAGTTKVGSMNVIEIHLLSTYYLSELESFTHPRC